MSLRDDVLWLWKDHVLKVPVIVRAQSSPGVSVQPTPTETMELFTAMIAGTEAALGALADAIEPPVKVSD